MDPAAVNEMLDGILNDESILQHLLAGQRPDASYRASHIKRARATKSEVEARRMSLWKIIWAMKPMTVRQVFYQATVHGIVEKSESGYNKVQTDVVLMRKAGVLPYDWLADNTRWQRRPRTCANLVNNLIDAED
jgi:hypothetical protein